MTDVVDGRLARALGRTSARGARLDSLADCALCLTVPPVVMIAFPTLREPLTAPFVLGYTAYGVPILVGLAKYRRLPAYHTTAARVAAVLLAATFIVFLATGVTWPLYVAVSVLLGSAVEEIAITALLPVWHADIPSIRHAARIRVHPGARRHHAEPERGRFAPAQQMNVVS